MKKGTKCDGCKTADAVVYFATVGIKGRTSRKQYCRQCAANERIRIAPQIVEPQIQDQSALGLVKQEIKKSLSDTRTGSGVPTVKSLEKDMQTAVKKENYKEAAQLRDQIIALKKQKNK